MIDFFFFLILENFQFFSLQIFFCFLILEHFQFFSLQDEAKRWKERGKQLFKENRFNLLVDCYSLAICYAPTSDRELLAQLLCNRSLAHIKNNAFTLALLDAERCVKIQPKWSKVEKNCLFI